MSAREPQSNRETTRGILDALAQGDPEGTVSFATVLDDFGERG